MFWRGLLDPDQHAPVLFSWRVGRKRLRQTYVARVGNQCEHWSLRAACRMFNIYMISTAGVADEDIDKCLQCARPFWLKSVSAGDAEFVLREGYGLSLTAHCCSRRIPEGDKCCSVPTIIVCKLGVCILVRPLLPNSAHDDSACDEAGCVHAARPG